MFTRNRYTWKCVIGGADGQTHEVEWSSYWSPDKVDSHEIALACATDMCVANKKRDGFAPISATLVT